MRRIPSPPLTRGKNSFVQKHHENNEIIVAVDGTLTSRNSSFRGAASLTQERLPLTPKSAVGAYKFPAELQAQCHSTHGLGLVDDSKYHDSDLESWVTVCRSEHIGGSELKCYIGSADNAAVSDNAAVPAGAVSDYFCGGKNMALRKVAGGDGFEMVGDCEWNHDFHTVLSDRFYPHNVLDFGSIPFTKTDATICTQQTSNDPFFFVARVADVWNLYEGFPQMVGPRKVF